MSIYPNVPEEDMIIIAKLSEKEKNLKDKFKNGILIQNH